MNPEPSPASPPGPRQWPRLSSPVMRLLLIGVLLLLLNIPIAMVRGVVEERAARRDQASADILSAWGGKQSLTGPILRLPFVIRTHSQTSDGKQVEQTASDAAYLLPRDLHVQGRLEAESRHRGIFEVPVYVARLELSGHFDPADLKDWPVHPEDIDWKHAELLLGLSEPRTLQADAAVKWDGQVLAFSPSTGISQHVIASGIHVPLGLSLEQVLGAKGSDFSIHLSFNGADAIAFSPTAEQTEIDLASGWPSPSFDGAWLPAQHSIDGDGFHARWSVSYLGRDYPQRWAESIDMSGALKKSQFGATLAQPVDPYTMALRVLKYALLTLVFTFAVIWLVEVLSGQSVHPIQYAMVGAALCLFGLLQLSFAEHFGFTVAFFVAAAAVVAMITLYSLSLLHNVWRALTVGGVLGGLYAYLYAILRAEDHALLGGSVALFVGLGLTMYLTRRVDWSGLGRLRVGSLS